MFSHAAIVAREMGLPMVAGVKHATKLLRNGDEVILNATLGSIKILKKFIFD